METEPPVVFVSYSHDSETHKNWVLQLATRLRSNGVDVLLDRWNLRYGRNVANFMEQGLSASRRVVCVCSKKYVDKSNAGIGGVGYEKQIISAEYLSDTNSEWVVPLIRENPEVKKLPAFLSGRLYIDFEDDRIFECRYEELLRELLDFPVLPIPQIGPNPFLTARAFAEQKFFPSSERYVSPASRGSVVFDYSNNNGHFSIGQGEFLFETKWSKSSHRGIILYNDPGSIKTVALAKDAQAWRDIVDARVYDSSSRTRRPNLGQIAVIQNRNGFYAAVKILAIEDDTRGSESDELRFEYVIQTNGSPDFSTIND